jgi:hypothetical protein
VPLALDAGTEYEVERSGLPAGWFDVAGARRVADDWFGFGSLKPYQPPPPKPLHPASNPPRVVHDAGDDRPHFVRRDAAPAPASGGSKPEPGSAGPAPAAEAPADPDRPRLRRRQAPADTEQAPPPSIPAAAPDPDRPRLSYGRPAVPGREPEPLTTLPVDMRQSVAVSDARTMDARSFAYEWAGAEEATAARQDAPVEGSAPLEAARR